MTNDSWVAKLDAEIPDNDIGDYEQVFAPLLKDYLLSNDLSSIDMARKIDDFTQQDLLESEPDLRSQEDQGMGAFLSELYGLVSLIARLLPYDGTEQEKLVQLLVQLRELPPRELRIFGKSCLVWQTDPVFASVLDDGWNANYPYAAQQKHDAEAWISFKEGCNRWVNFSSFLARCLEAGVLDRPDMRLTFARIDISKGLDETWPNQEERHCKVTVSAQYILLAGRSLAEICFKRPDSVFHPESWKHWTTKFEEVSAQENDTPLASITKEAHQYMTSLAQELSA